MHWYAGQDLHGPTQLASVLQAHVLLLLQDG